MSEAFDAVVVGGSTIGAAAALALARLGHEVAIIDRSEPADTADDAPLDARVVAVSPGSMQLLEALDAWRHVREGRVAAYHEMQVMSGRGHVEFAAGEHGLPALGWIVELGELDRACWQALATRRRITRLVPGEVEAIDVDGDAARVRLSDGNRVEGAMLIGADGQQSRVRAAAGIGVTSHHYNQKAIVTHLETEKLNPGIAWQRFTELGPLALLPLPEGRSSLVWSVHDDEAARLMQLDDEAFCDALAEHAAGSPFGAFETLEQRHAIALVRRQSEALAAGRVALAGDAARSVHPLAGQGLNLGLGDVAALIEQFSDVKPGDMKPGGLKPGADPTRRLARYSRRRFSDSVLVAGGIHLFNEVRTLGTPGLYAMGAGFDAMRLSRPARDAFVRRACGLDEVGKAVALLAE